MKHLTPSVSRNKNLATKFAARGGPIATSEMCAELGGGVRMLNDFLLACRHLPWIEIRRVKGGAIFTIDAELKDICELRERHEALGGRSITECLTELRREIARRRKENNANREKRPWNVEATIKLELIKLLDWIEDELGKINP